MEIAQASPGVFDIKTVVGLRQRLRVTIAETVSEDAPHLGRQVTPRKEGAATREKQVAGRAIPAAGKQAGGKIAKPEGGQARKIPNHARISYSRRSCRSVRPHARPSARSRRCRRRCRRARSARSSAPRRRARRRRGSRRARGTPRPRLAWNRPPCVRVVLGAGRSMVWPKAEEREQAPQRPKHRTPSNENQAARTQRTDACVWAVHSVRSGRFSPWPSRRSGEFAGRTATRSSSATGRRSVG